MATPEAKTQIVIVADALRKVDNGFFSDQKDVSQTVEGLITLAQFPKSRLVGNLFASVYHELTPDSTLKAQIAQQLRNKLEDAKEKGISDQQQKILQAVNLLTLDQHPIYSKYFKDTNIDETSLPSLTPEQQADWDRRHADIRGISNEELNRMLPDSLPAEEPSTTPEDTSDPEIVNGLKTMADTIRQTFSDNQRTVYSEKGGMVANVPSLEDIINEFALEGGLTWRFKEKQRRENKMEFEGVNDQGKVIIEGSFNNSNHGKEVKSEDITIQMFKNRLDFKDMRILIFTESRITSPQIKEGRRPGNPFELYMPPIEDYEVVENISKELNYNAVGKEFSRIHYLNNKGTPVSSYIPQPSLPAHEALEEKIPTKRVPDNTSSKDLIKFVNQFLGEYGRETKRDVKVNPEVLARYIKDTVTFPFGAGFADGSPFVEIIKREPGNSILQIDGKIGTALRDRKGKAYFSLWIANKPDGGIEVIKKSIQADGQVKTGIDKGENKIETINETLIDETNKRIDQEWETANFYIADDGIVFEFRKK